MNEHNLSVLQNKIIKIVQVYNLLVFENKLPYECIQEQLRQTSSFIHCSELTKDIVNYHTKALFSYMIEYNLENHMKYLRKAYDLNIIS